MKRGLSLVMLAGLLLAAGCHTGDAFRRTTARVQQGWSAEKAWRTRKWMYAGLPCRGTFKNGFMDGYRSACGDASIQTPGATANASVGGEADWDREHSRAWNDGFSHGSLAAQQDLGLVPSSDATAPATPEGMQQPPMQYMMPPANSPQDAGPGPGGARLFENAVPPMPQPAPPSEPAGPARQSPSAGGGASAMIMPNSDPSMFQGMPPMPSNAPATQPAAQAVPAFIGNTAGQPGTTWQMQSWPATGSYPAGSYPTATYPAGSNPAGSYPAGLYPAGAQPNGAPQIGADAYFAAPMGPMSVPTMPTGQPQGTTRPDLEPPAYEESGHTVLETVPAAELELPSANSPEWQMPLVPAQ